MSIYKSAVERPITTILIFIALVVFGVYSLINMPLDQFPEMELPYITVITSYPGASATDIETNITRPIEDALSSVSNLKEMTSTSSDNLSAVFLEFEYGSNLDDIMNDVRNYVGLLSNALPDDATDPTILKLNTSMMPVLIYTVTADESYNGLERILDDNVIPQLNRLNGVGSVSANGTPGRTIYIDVDPQKMEAYNLSIEQIGSVIAGENLNMSAGYMMMGNTDYSLRVQGEFSNSDILSDIVVGSFNGSPVYIHDIAQVRDTLTDSRLYSYVNGKQGIVLTVQKQSDANTVNVARSVKKTLNEIFPTLPPDIEIDVLMDSSEFIEDSVSNLTETLLYAFLFVILVVLFFLGRWRATIIIVLTIPISMMVSFIYLYFTGGTINMITLSALSIAIGMVVDDAIVVLENITTHVERGTRPREAAIYATNEVWLAVIVTTLTVVAVFFPMTLVSGLVGEMFRPLGMIVSISVVASTLAAITLTPTLSALMLRVRNKVVKPKRFSYDGIVLPMLDTIDRGYEKLLRWAITHKTIVAAVTLLIFVSSMFLFTKINVEFMPESDQSSISVTMELQSGTRSDKSNQVALRLSSIIQEKYPEVELFSSSTGTSNASGISAMMGGSSSNHVVSMNISLCDIDERERSVWDIAEELRGEIAQFPEVITYKVSTNSGAASMMSSEVRVNVFGFDIEETNLVAKELAAKLRELENARDVEISRDESKPELQIVLDQEKMAQHGLNTATVSTYVRNRLNGLTASKYREDGDEYDIVVRFDREQISSLDDVENIGIINAQGQKIRLAEIANIEEFWAPPSISRLDKERVVSVSATPYKTSLLTMRQEIQAIIDDIDMPSDVYCEISGSIEETMNSMQNLLLVLIVSLILVYIVMASQFESLRMPAVIMFAIPFAFTGVAIALYLTGTTLNIIAGVGAIMLVGIVVKNGIVLVDYINLMRERGVELYEAVAMSGRLRLRPVLMTTATTILGMLPLAMSSGEGSEMWSPMGVTIIGGLTISTLITLIIVPVMYIIFVRKSERKSKLRNRQELASFIGE